MSDLRRLALRAEAGLFSAVFAIAVLGAALLPVTSSLCVRALVTAVDSASLTGLDEQATLQAAEAVRVFVIDTHAPGLPATIDGVPAFDEQAVSHLVDVRDVLIPARLLTFALLAAAGLWGVLRGRSASGRRVVGSACRGAAAALAGGAALAVVVGAVDFDALFSWFHSLFFAPGTWMFPEDALLIRVFPLPFWISSGALWGVGVLMCSAILFVVGRRLRFTGGNNSV
jgi:hypothetical protein